MKNHPPRIILASGSVYRRELLSRLVKFFDSSLPDIDESRIENETAINYVKRLAQEKAEAVASTITRHKNATPGLGGSTSTTYENLRDKPVAEESHSLIIGSDQTAVIGDQLLGKPGNFERAFQQLRVCSGNRVRFVTGLALLDSKTGRIEVEIDEVKVQFRHLSDQEIEAYLNEEEPYDCAGSFKCEGLGIALFDSIESNDPNSLVGLPLIQLNKMLLRFGYNPLFNR